MPLAYWLDEDKLKSVQVQCRIQGGGGAKVDLRMGRPLRAEFALSTVATVTRVIARYETLCRGVARNFYILRQEIGLGFVTT